MPFSVIFSSTTAFWQLDQVALDPLRIKCCRWSTAPRRPLPAFIDCWLAKSASGIALFKTAPVRHSKKPYSAFFLGLAGLSSWTRFKTNVAFFSS